MYNFDFSCIDADARLVFVVWKNWTFLTIENVFCR